MTDQNGETGFETAENVLEDHGNFALDMWRGVIRDDSNGNKNATTSAPNVDFIGPAIVVNTPAADAASNYRYAVRVENRDNDGIGLLFRVRGRQQLVLSSQLEYRRAGGRGRNGRDSATYWYVHSKV